MFQGARVRPTVVANKASTVETTHDANAALIHQTLVQQRRMRSDFVDECLRFSYLRHLLTIFTYVLLCSDIPRSGLGMHNLELTYGVHEVDSISMFGPWSYSINTTTKATAMTKPAPVWAYKYSSTSIVWRAAAQALNVTSFPQCFFYEFACNDEVLFGADVAFQFIDELVERMKALPQPYGRPGEAVELVLRSSNKFYDRIHHYLLPWLFVRPVWRTNQVLHYPSELLLRRNTTTTGTTGARWIVDGRLLCFRASGVRPHFCDDLWINYARSCLPTDTACKRVGVMWADTMRRVMVAQLKNPKAKVDLTVLSSNEDAQVNQGGLGHMARRKTDVSTVIRVRNCTETTLGVEQCDTLVVDDYRYDVGVFTTDVPSWYTIVSTLRSVGQAHFYLRVILLLVGCYITRAAEEKYAKASEWRRLRAAIHLFVRIPNPSLVYGSPVPVVCYALAHIIDAPLTQERIAMHFAKALGQYKFEWRPFFQIAAIQMRNVWLLALLAHIIRRCVVRHSWPAQTGILTVPGFALGILSSITMLCHLRQVSFRDSRMLTLRQLPPRSNVVMLKNEFVFSNHARGNVFLEGVILGFKFFFCILVVVCLLGFLASHAAKRIGGKRLLSRVPVPYTAGVFWPTIAQCIRWTGDIVDRELPPEQVRSKRRLTLRAAIKKISAASVAPPVAADIPAKISSVRRATIMEWPAHQRARHNFLIDQMEHIADRRHDVTATVALLNLISMTDPWVLLSMRWWGCSQVFYVQSQTTKKVFALPEGVVQRPLGADVPWHDLTLLRIVSTRDIPWSDLLHVG
ncbi:TPA: hypothetical protein N0F65_007603 [Lagenidium giganteum]|uniref:Transmembrane protein n=1 Tax=Lagenidium giganteum TaxID=4803 RepID=A0AAV2ZD56_9STRA|nr:TPA: hypothetical protein N0F65_007603 [Lagenidium giganteum]